MAEYFFESEVLLTKEIAKEVAKAPLKNILLLSYIIGIIFVLIALLLQEITIMIPGIVFPLILQFFVTSMAKQLSKQWRILGGSIGEEGIRHKTQFFEDTFTLNALKDEHVFRYGQISKIVEMKLCFHIILEKTLIVVVKKDGFTKGDCKAFSVFLCERPEIKPKVIRGLKKRNRVLTKDSKAV